MDEKLLNSEQRPCLRTSGVLVESINTAFKEFTGYSEKECVGRKINDVFNNLLRATEKNLESLNSGKTAESFIFTKSFEVREIVLTVNSNVSCSERVYILEEKPNSRLEEKFSYVDQLYKDDFTGIAIYTCDLVLLRANQTYLKFLDDPYQKFDNSFGRRLHQIVEGFSGCDTEKLWKGVLETGKTLYIKENMVERVERGITYWDSTIAPIFEKEKIKYLIENTVDVTERVVSRKRIEEQNRIIQKQKEQLERNVQIMERSIEMKDEFVSMVTHEFKTPLTVINSAIQAMEHLCRHELSPKAKSFLSKIKQNTFRQLKLVNNLLEITRANAGHMKLNVKNHDLVFHTKLIIESVYLYSQQRGINLCFSTNTRKKVIGVDDEKYERILLNLLSNAIKFTPEGKRIWVSISSRKGYVHLKVKDEGIGIPKEKQEMIFERFGQVDSSLSRQAEGSGIGLSLVKMLVENMGGKITLKSKPGKGSTFSVLLPAQLVEETMVQEKFPEFSDNKVVHSVAIEFSDIYLS